jgi:DegV family protein with EDD domain
MEKVQIITDSSTLYTAEEARQAGFEAVPLCIHIGELEGRDLQLDMDDYYERIGRGEMPRSSQPPIGDVVEAYEAHPDCEILDIAMADGLSGTYQSAHSAAQIAKNSDRITVFNSRTLCGPHRYMVECAQRMSKKGTSKDKILAWLEQKTKETESFLIPQDFSFLKRGGRLTPVAAALGTVLKLKPVMRLTDDGTRLDKFLVKRTMSASVKGIIDYLKEKQLGPGHILYIAHARALQDAQSIKKQFEAAFPGLEVQILELSPVFVAQGGPHCVAIQYIHR